MKHTEISTLGEFGLIRHLTEDIHPHDSSTVYGIGDDCAVMRYPAGTAVLASTDMLMEGIHFDLVYTPLKHLGYKSRHSQLFRPLCHERHAATNCSSA